VDALRSLLFAVVFYCGSAAYVLLAVALIGVAPARVAPVANSWSRFHRNCVEHILGIKVVVEGARLPGAALYALKHESFFEAIDLPMLLGHPVPFAKEELFAIPGWGRVARLYGAIPVARQEGAKALRSMARDAGLVATSGRPLAIFPEGTRVPHGTRAPLQAGFAAMYKLLGLPVVPVAVDSGRLYGGFWKRRGTITIRFGALIAPGLSRGEVEAQVLEAINVLNPEAPTLA
jgi:1-acyl-sn-glycerol-3-phosphate acyltransferase